jgi:subtilisin family serine protease
MLLSLCLVGSLAGLSLSASFEKAYIVGLSSASGSSLSLYGRSLDPHEIFHRRAESLNYTVRHEFKNSDIYFGLSIQVSSAASDAEIRAELGSIPGVARVSKVHPVSVALPNLPTNNTIVNPSPSSESTAKSTPSLPPVHSAAGLQGALRMGGVDKLHAAGIKGKGIKIGVVDTGVDYNHPALGLVKFRYEKAM